MSRLVTKRQTLALADREIDEQWKSQIGDCDSAPAALAGRREASECGMELNHTVFTKVGGSAERWAVLETSTVAQLLTGVAVAIAGLAVIIVVDLTLGDLWLVLWALAVAVLLRSVVTGKLP